MICERSAREEAAMAWSRTIFLRRKTKRSYLPGNFTTGISGRLAEERRWRCRRGRIRYLRLISTISLPVPPTRAPHPNPPPAGAGSVSPWCSNPEVSSRTTKYPRGPWEQLDPSLCLMESLWRLGKGWRSITIESHSAHATLRYIRNIVAYYERTCSFNTI